MLKRLENAKKIEITLQIWHGKSASRPRACVNSKYLFKPLSLKWRLQWNRFEAFIGELCSEISHAFLFFLLNLHFFPTILH